MAITKLPPLSAVISRAPSPSARPAPSSVQTASSSARNAPSSARSASPAVGAPRSLRSVTSTPKPKTTTGSDNQTPLKRRATPSLMHPVAKRVDLKEELKQMTIERDHMKVAKDQMTIQLEQAQRRIQDLTVEVDAYRSELEILKAELASCKEEILYKDLESRHLLNDLIDCKGQIRVAVRTRSFLPNESFSSHLSYPAPNAITIEVAGMKPQTYEYQKVFGPNISQQRLFEDIEELILSVLHGYNVSIIAFGQTGSGKTYTMRGGDDEDTEGIIPRAAKCLFKNRDKLVDLGWKFTLTASYVEVYNEEIYDLLANKAKVSLKKSGSLQHAENITRKTISSLSMIHQILLMADKNRSVAATKCNEESSRSHAIFEIKIDAKNEVLNCETSSVLQLVDLAGSERVKESGAQGMVFKEMTHINQSLSALQMCVRAQLNKQFVPYRNSKLTSLLSTSLGAGSSKTFILVALNPSISQTGETKRSLDFAKEMSNTKIGAALRNDK